MHAELEAGYVLSEARLAGCQYLQRNNEPAAVVVWGLNYWLADLSGSNGAAEKGLNFTVRYAAYHMSNAAMESAIIATDRRRLCEKLTSRHAYVRCRIGGISFVGALQPSSSETHLPNAAVLLTLSSSLSASKYGPSEHHNRNTRLQVAAPPRYSSSPHLIPSGRFTSGRVLVPDSSHHSTRNSQSFIHPHLYHWVVKPSISVYRAHPFKSVRPACG
ncbi:hypothetical protein EV127DRAFT_410553 [Xylaria flabelliformis]|nr:hypothetical protein EV127DRAFT_410553 [Xylaria flabelliformis]